MKNKLTAPEGGTEMLFDESASRAEAEARLRRLFEGCGYCEVVTPTFEYYDLFSEGAGALEQSEMFTLCDRTGRLLVLRPDSTKPIARLYASRLKNPEFPVRLYYNQPVFRRNPAHSAKCDEVMQIGAELLGKGGKSADLEAVALAVESLSAVSEDFLFELSHVGVYRTLIESLGVPDALAEELRECIAQKNFSALDTLLAENEVKDAEKIKLLPRLFGGAEVLEEARALFADAGETLDYLQEIMDSLTRLGVKGKISFDLALLNEYNYYTGLVFKGYTDAGGEVLSGGRYDTLYEDFGLSVDAVGFAVNLDALAGDARAKAPELVLVRAEDPVKAICAQRELMRSGVRAALATDMNREEAERYAKKIGASRTVEV